MKRHPVSGLPYIASPIGPKVTDAEIKAALAAGKWADKDGKPITIPADWKPEQRKAASK